MNSYGETAGNIGLKVKAKTKDGDFVKVRIGNITTSMAPLLTHELERIAHTMRATEYTEQTTGKMGFPYDLPATLGE